MLQDDTFLVVKKQPFILFDDTKVFQSEIVVFFNQCRDETGGNRAGWTGSDNYRDIQTGLFAHVGHHEQIDMQCTDTGGKARQAKGRFGEISKRRFRNSLFFETEPQTFSFSSRGKDDRKPSKRFGAGSK